LLPETWSITSQSSRPGNPLLKVQIADTGADLEHRSTNSLLSPSRLACGSGGQAFSYYSKVVCRRRRKASRALEQPKRHAGRCCALSVQSLRADKGCKAGITTPTNSSDAAFPSLVHEVRPEAMNSSGFETAHQSCSHGCGRARRLANRTAAREVLRRGLPGAER
jgi:hypothetical protein